MESTNTQATASKVSLLMLGQQAVIDAYLCLLHLTTGEIASCETVRNNNHHFTR